MKRLLPLLLLLASACAEAPPDSATRDPEEAVVQVKGEIPATKLALLVDAVDLEHRLIKLHQAGCEPQEYPVGPELKRLAQIHVGDSLPAEYHVTYVADLRSPTPDEESCTHVLPKPAQSGDSKAPPEETIVRSLRRAVVLEHVHDEDAHFRFRSPLGTLIPLQAEHPDALSPFGTRQKIVVTFGETLRLSQEPAPKK